MLWQPKEPGNRKKQKELRSTDSLKEWKHRAEETYSKDAEEKAESL